jgi:hypothetical protein
LDDDELKKLMTRADPAVTSPSAPLSLRATEDLARITAGTLRQRRRVSRLLLLPAIAVIAVVGIFAVQSLSPTDPTATRALAATPTPLEAHGAPLPIEQALTMAIEKSAANDDFPDAAEQQSVREAWYAEIEMGEDGATSAAISPQEISFTWHDDLSGHLTVIAGEPFDPEHNGTANDVEPPEPGTVLRDESYMAGGAGVLYPDLPPSDAAAMAVTLESGGWVDPTDAFQLVDAISMLYNEWTLTRAQHSSVLQVLRSFAEQKDAGLTSIGMVTDRLGREGAAFVARSDAFPNHEETIVISLETGTLLSVETTYIGGLPEIDDVVIAPAVLSYTAWD